MPAAETLSLLKSAHLGQEVLCGLQGPSSFQAAIPPILIWPVQTQAKSSHAGGSCPIKMACTQTQKTSGMSCEGHRMAYRDRANLAEDGMRHTQRVQAYGYLFPFTLTTQSLSQKVPHD